MKKTIFLISFLIAAISCENSATTESKNNKSNIALKSVTSNRMSSYGPVFFSDNGPVLITGSEITVLKYNTAYYFGNNGPFYFSDNGSPDEFNDDGSPTEFSDYGPVYFRTENPSYFSDNGPVKIKLNSPYLFKSVGPIYFSDNGSPEED